MPYNILRRFDLSGQNLSINFQKKSTHQTLFGGVLSLLVYIGIFLYAIEKIHDCARKRDTKITSTQKMLDLKKNVYVNLEGSGFEIIAGFRDKKNIKKIVKLPKSIGTVTLMNIA